MEYFAVFYLVLYCKCFPQQQLIIILTVVDVFYDYSTAFRTDETSTSSITRRQEKSFIYFDVETCACDALQGAPYNLQSLIQHHPPPPLSPTVAVLLLSFALKRLNFFVTSINRIDVVSRGESVDAGGCGKSFLSTGTYAKRLGLRVVCVSVATDCVVCLAFLNTKEMFLYTWSSNSNSNY